MHQSIYNTASAFQMLEKKHTTICMEKVRYKGKPKENYAK